MYLWLVRWHRADNAPSVSISPGMAMECCPAEAAVTNSLLSAYMAFVPLKLLLWRRSRSGLDTKSVMNVCICRTAVRTWSNTLSSGNEITWTYWHMLPRQVLCIFINVRYSLNYKTDLLSHVWVDERRYTCLSNNSLIMQNDFFLISFPQLKFLFRGTHGINVEISFNVKGIGETGKLDRTVCLIPPT